MRPAGPRSETQRTTHFESCESRIVMSAQAAADFYLDYLSGEDIATFDEAGWREVHHQFSSAHDLTGLAGVRDNYGLSGSGQTVVVIDSGVAYDHPALGGGFGGNYRVVGGWDFTEENDTDPYDDGASGSHGTHVAGIIGSNDAQYPGVAPGVDLVALRVFNDFGAGYFEWVEDALQWVHDNRHTFESPITAVNLSLGASWNADSIPSWAMLEDEFAQLEADGIFIGVAAGNSFVSYGEPGLGYPAASPYVVPVAAVDDDGSLSYFSQRNDRVIAAPGRDIVSTVPDYAGDGDGQADDFASYSGTSMATPYVTGASVLIREALEFAGQTDITQDRIYEVMWQTGDRVWDDVTGQFYTRLNLEAALTSIMPADDFGSTVDSAYTLGTVAPGNTASIDGVIDAVDDVDYFRFTAGESGVARVTFKSPDGSVAAWLSGSGNSTQGTNGNYEVVFEVVAGEQYVVGVGSESGPAHYELSASVDAGMTDWGTVVSARFQNQRIAATESWYQFAAGLDGLVTVQAFFASSGGDIHLEIYDSSNRLLATSAPADGHQRLDVAASAGEVFHLKVVGRNADVDFQVTNLVHVNGQTVSVNGTALDDHFSYQAGRTLQMSVNGVSYAFDGTHVRTVRFYGNAGADEIVLSGTAANDQAVLTAKSVTLSSEDYAATAYSVESIHVDAGGGTDMVRLYDTPDNDRLTLSPGAATLRGDGYRNSAAGFETVYALATAGGHDQVTFYDSSHNDIFVALPSWARMKGDGFYNYARGFDDVVAHATEGGTADYAIFFDSAGNDRFTSQPAAASMRGDGYANEASGFDRFYAYAIAGGEGDEAFLYDSAGADLFVARSQWARMQGDDLYSYVKGFDTVRSFASSGNDLAVLYDSDGDDSFVAHAGWAQLDGAGFQNYAQGFASVTAHATNGYDTAHFYDSSGNDQFVVNDTVSYLRGDGFFNVGKGFDRVYAHTQSGEDQVILYNVYETDYLYGRDEFFYLATDRVAIWTYSADLVTAHAAAGQSPTADVSAVDYLFKQVGQWLK